MIDFLELKNKYLEVFPVDALNLEELDNIETKLGVTLPDDFKQITKFFSGGSVGGIEFYDFKIDNDINIIGETLRLREVIDLPKQYIVLAEPPESIVIIDTKNIPVVIWCDAIDVENIASNNYSTQPDVWDNFSEFFYEMLLDELQ